MVESTNYKTYYDLEIKKLIDDVNKNKFQLVLLQFPDGLKYYSKEVIDELEKKTSAVFITFFGTCFGACDVPVYLESLKFDLCIQWGHTVFVKTPDMW